MKGGVKTISSGLGRSHRTMMGTEKSDDVYTRSELQHLYNVTDINKLPCRPAFELSHKQNPYGKYNLS